MWKRSSVDEEDRRYLMRPLKESTEERRVGVDGERGGGASEVGGLYMRKAESLILSISDK